jgi:hypothetical protein
MWMEPADAASVRSPVRDRAEPGVRLPNEPAIRTLFNDWNIEQASSALEQEVQRRAAARK